MPNYFINVKEKGAKKAEKNILGLNNALGGLASKAAMAAGGFFGASMLLSGMRQAIDLAGEQEKAEKTLEVALGRRSQALLDQASALQQVSTFGDETIIAAQALIASFVDDEEQVKAATKATLDLAAAKGMDLAVAADLVSKTLGSSTNALSRYGIQVIGAVGSTERLESLTSNLANVFGGQAAAQAETMSGKLDQMKNAVGDTGEAIGTLLTPFVNTLSESFKGAAENATGFIKSLTDEEAETVSLTAERNADAYRMFGDAIGFIAGKIGDMLISEDSLRGKLEESIRLQTERNEKFSMGTVSLLEYNKEQENYLSLVEKVTPTQKMSISFWDGITDSIRNNTRERAKNVSENLKGYAMTSGAAEDAMRSVVKAEAMEAVAGLIASILKNVPFPLNAILAAGAGATASGLIDKGLEATKGIKFAASGMSEVVSQPTMIIAGESGAESVNITPLSDVTQPTGNGGGLTVNLSGNVLTQDFVEGELAEAIANAVSRGTNFGMS